VAVVETRVSLWEALAGRAPGQPIGPADQGLWTAVAERVNPAKARPCLRRGIEESNLTSVRGVRYAMLRSPDGRQACYLRLAPEEVELTPLMDGTRTLARLVADFAGISGRLAPDQVRRIVADLAGNRMLEELPVDAYRPLQKVNRRPWPIRFGRGMLAFIQGRRVVLANIDPLITFLYRAGGRVLFTRAAVAFMATLAVLGLVAFGWQWWTGAQSVFLTGDSYFLGAAALLGLNVLALACHELGHALATKHAGRRVPAAGFLVYFGIPSVFVDTTDVWMAGRRGRLLATAAGPAAGLILAGTSALVGFVAPEAAPWAFKLSFAWYINALFNLNPFLALDGYYLLMDWLEVPNLRARGLAWVVARVRRKPPAWRALDREGRLVALYGVLAVGWLVIALNIAYRVYTDRVGGLITGLWRSGWPARVLLVATVAALMSPLVYVLFGWLARRGRRLRRRVAERRIAQDAPRRLDALRASTLRDLPGPVLADLAEKARWIHPRTGQQLVVAGAAQPHVYAVVEGALEGRAAGDPVGTVRERVGAGGVVGIGTAVNGAPSPLAWYTAGTTLLAIPSAAVAGVAGAAIAGSSFGADSFGTAAEAEGLLGESPATGTLSTEDTMGLASVAVPIALAPGAPVTLASPEEALLVASGVVALPSGQELGRGSLIGPAGVENAGTVGTARTSVRLFSLPAVSGLPLLVGATPASLAAADARAPGRAPVFGVHAPAGYPPLAAPPGPPPPLPPGHPGTDDQDRQFERKLRWLLIFVLLLAFGFTGGNLLLPRLAWAEMPSDKVLLQVPKGTVSAIVNGERLELTPGDEVYLGESDEVKVAAKSRGLLIYRGGSSSILCAGTRLEVGVLSSGAEQIKPTATMTLLNGLALSDTASASPDFANLAATWRADAGSTVNEGPAWFAVASWGTVVSEGAVWFGGSPVAPTGQPLGCGDGDGDLPRPSQPTSPPPTATPSATPTETPTPTPSPTPSTAPSTAPTPTPTGVPSTTTRTTTTTTTKPPATSTPPSDQEPPTISRPSWDAKVLAQIPPAGSFCGESQYTDRTLMVSAPVSDPAPSSGGLVVQMTWTLNIGGLSGTILMPSIGGGVYETKPALSISWQKGYELGGTITLTIRARDAAGNVANPVSFTVGLDVCYPVPIIR
jgi:putative peptide zinc metalloprotease protein